jgi:hypothetical protein
MAVSGNSRSKKLACQETVGGKQRARRIEERAGVMKRMKTGTK